MVGLVIVSHSQPLAEGLLHLIRIMAKEVKVELAGGLEDGSPGTSYDLIRSAIIKADSGDGVVVMADLGSSVMTAEMVLEDLPDGIRAVLADCPLVEGAVAASVCAESGDSMEDVKAEAENAWPVNQGVNQGSIRGSIRGRFSDRHISVTVLPDQDCLVTGTTQKRIG